MKRLLFLIACLGACGDDGSGGGGGGGGDPDARPIDGAVSNDPLVGTWNRAADPPPGSTTFAQLAFHADGTIRADVGGGTKDGIWSEPSAGRVRVSDPDGSNAVEVDYRIDGSRMGYDVFLPMGSVNGLVGTWVQTNKVDANTVVQTLVVNADHTMSLAIGGSPITGTWTMEGTGLAYTTGLGTEHARPFMGALTGLVYDKQ